MEQGSTQLDEVYAIDEDSYAEELTELDQEDNFALSVGLALMEQYLISMRQNGELDFENFEKNMQRVVRLRKKIIEGINRRKERNAENRDS